AEQCLPAPGQGALGVECRRERADLLELVAPLGHAPTALCVTAERAFSRALTRSCNVPPGAYAEGGGERWRLGGFVGAPDGSRAVYGERTGSAAGPEEIGMALADELRSRGAEEILAALRNQ